MQYIYKIKCSKLTFVRIPIMDMKVQVDEAPAKFNEIMEKINRGKSVILMDKNKPVARIIPLTPDKKSGREDKWTSEDFDIQLSEDI
jgi:prevent-host-death family protein